MKPRPVHYFPPGFGFGWGKSLCNNFRIRPEVSARWISDPAAVTCRNCRKHSQFPVEAAAGE